MALHAAIPRKPEASCLISLQWPSIGACRHWWDLSFLPLANSELQGWSMAPLPGHTAMPSLNTASSCSGCSGTGWNVPPKARNPSVGDGGSPVDTHKLYGCISSPSPPESRHTQVLHARCGMLSERGLSPHKPITLQGPRGMQCPVLWESTCVCFQGCCHKASQTG